MSFEVPLWSDVKVYSISNFFGSLVRLRKILFDIYQEYNMRIPE